MRYLICEFDTHEKMRYEFLSDIDYMLDFSFILSCYLLKTWQSFAFFIFTGFFYISCFSSKEQSHIRVFTMININKHNPVGALRSEMVSI